METVSVMWEGIPVEATVTPPIAQWDPPLSVTTVRRTEHAAAAARAAATLAAGQLEAAARLPLRAEGLASSAIEGLRASPADVAIAQGVGAEGSTAAWVADNLAVVSDALGHDGPIDAETLFAWHRRLMRNSPTVEDRHVGAWRDTLGWVGGQNPRLAAHVAVPAESIAPAMEDLFAFVARDDLDPVTQAGVAHAQFETIHPFADGNGRIGRVLIGWILAHRLELAVPPPVSLELARQVGGYQAGLTLYRLDGHDAWVAWFADAVRGAAEGAAALLAAVEELVSRWRWAIGDLRADAVAHRFVELLPAHPVLSSASAAALTGVSRRAASNGLTELAARGVIVDVGTVPSGRGRPERWWVAQDLLALLGR